MGLLILIPGPNEYLGCVLIVINILLTVWHAVGYCAFPPRYFVGPTPRGLRKLVGPASSGGLAAAHLCEQIDKSRTSGARHFLRPEAARFLDELLRLLVDANADLVKVLRNQDDSCNIHALLADDWEAKLASVDFATAQDAFTKLAKLSDYPRDHAFFLGVLDEIADHGLIAIRNEGMAYRIWPAFSFQIVYAHSNTLTAASLELTARLHRFIHFAQKVKLLARPVGIVAKAVV